MQANTITEQIHQVLGKLFRMYNLQETYLDDADPWMVILAAIYFAVRSSNHIIKGINFSPTGIQPSMIPSIKHIANWRYICQRKQAQV